MSQDRDLPRDEHLRVALRHAPDADMQAPPDIRERLLAEARRAVAPATATQPAPWWRRWLPARGWLPQGAFASLLIAGLVTVLWQDEEVPAPTVDSRAPAVASETPAPAASAAPAVATARAPEPEPQAPAPMPARAAQKSAQPELDKAARIAAQEARREAAATAAAAESSRRAEAAKAAAPPPAPAAPMAPAANNAALAEARPAPAAATARLRAPAAAGASRAATSGTPAPPWGTAAAPPQALSELAARTSGPWRDAVQPAGQPRLTWEHEGSPVGRAWLERRADAEWLVWCAAGASTCREAPLDK